VCESLTKPRNKGHSEAHWHKGPAMLITFKLSEGCICKSRLCGHSERFTGVRTSATAATQVSVKHIKIVTDELHLRSSQWWLCRVLFFGTCSSVEFYWRFGGTYCLHIPNRIERQTKARSKRKAVCFTYSYLFDLTFLAWLVDKAVRSSETSVNFYRFKNVFVIRVPYKTKLQLRSDVIT
jgi:hypothetical protein